MTWAVKGKGLEGLEEKTEDGNPEREKEREGERKTEKARETSPVAALQKVTCVRFANAPIYISG